MLAEDVFESGDLELLSEEEVMEINGGCGSAKMAKLAPGPMRFYDPTPHLYPNYYDNMA